MISLKNGLQQILNKKDTRYLIYEIRFRKGFYLNKQKINNKLSNKIL